MLLSEYIPTIFVSILKCDATQYENNSITEKFNLFSDVLNDVVYTEPKVTVTVNTSTIIEFDKVI